MQEDCAHTVLSFTNLEKRKIFYNTKSNRLYRAIGRSFTLQQTSTDKFTGQQVQTNQLFYNLKVEAFGVDRILQIMTISRDLTLSKKDDKMLRLQP
jgi:hypothetical protein